MAFQLKSGWGHYISGIDYQYNNVIGYFFPAHVCKAMRSQKQDV